MKYAIRQLIVATTFAAISHVVAPFVAAQTDVPQLRQQVAQAKSAALSAETAVAKATERAKELRSKLEEEYETNPEMLAARKQLESHKTSLDQYKTPILENLQQQPEYQAKVSRRDEARKNLKSKEFSLAVLALKKMESDAIEANPQAKAALAAFTASEARVRELVERHRATMLQDPRVVAIRAEIDKGKEAVAQARQKRAAAVRSLGVAEQKLAQARQRSQPRRPTPRRR